jgi:hypothetical protein
MIVRHVRAYEGETVIITWTYDDKTTLEMPLTAPPAVVKAARRPQDLADERPPRDPAA